MSAATTTTIRLRRIALAAALAGVTLAARPAEAAIARVQSATGTNSGSTSVSVSWGTATTTGNLLVAVVGLNPDSASTVTVTPPSGGWTSAVRVDNGTAVSTVIYYIKNAASQNTGNKTWSLSPSSHATINVIEYSGADQFSPLDRTVSTTGSGTTGSTGTTATTSYDSELSIAAITVGANTSWSAETNSYVEVSDLASGSGMPATRNTTVTAEKLLTAKSAETMSATSGTGNWAGAIATFHVPVKVWHGIGTGLTCAGQASYWNNLDGTTASAIPAASEVAVFNGTSTADCSQSGAVALDEVQINSGYTGTVTSTGTVTTTRSVTVAAGAFTGPVAVGGTFTLSGGTFNAASSNSTFTGAATISSGTFNGASGRTAGFSTLTVSGGTLDVNGGIVTASGAVLISGGSYRGDGTSTFSSTLGVSSGSYDAETGSSSVAGLITVNGGTYKVGSGAQTASAGLTMSSGTLDMSSDNGQLNLGNGAVAQTLTISGGAFQVTGTTASTYPLITRGGSANYAFSITGGTLSLNGLRVQNTNLSGMAIASTATLSTFKNVRFSANAGGVGSRHLSIARDTSASSLTAPGCAFDTTAASNVVTTGTAGTKTFYFDQVSGLGGEGDTLDSDGDASPDNGVVDVAGTNSTLVVWLWNIQTDTAGSIQGFPGAAFDWNNFTFYSVYAAYSTAAANTDRIYVRSVNGNAAYSYDINTTTYGSIVGTPRWDTANETATYDVDGDGVYSETNIHVLYVPTSNGFIFKLIDTGTAVPGLTLPGTNNTWHDPFPTGAPTGSVTINNITSPLVSDGTNLYFGGKDGSNAVQIFGVQIASGATTCNGSSVADGQKCSRTYDPGVGLTAITNTPSVAVFSGSTYLYMATVNGATNNIIRYNVTTGVAPASYTTVGAVTGSVRRVAHGLFAADSTGRLYQLNANPTLGSGTFTTVGAFPYVVTGNPVLSTPYVHASGPAVDSFFGDANGKLYRVDLGGNLVTGWPVVTGGSAITAAPLYLSANQYLIAGDTGGKVYYIDAATQTLKYTLTLSGSISTISYNAAANSSAGELMVGTSTGGFYYLPKQLP